MQQKPMVKAQISEHPEGYDRLLRYLAAGVVGLLAFSFLLWLNF